MNDDDQVGDPFAEWEHRLRERVSGSLADAADRVLEGTYPTPRADSLKSRVHSVAGLMELGRLDVDELHTLAYDRRKAAGERVKGGEVDYALDTNGDPKARAHYRMLSILLTECCVLLAEGFHEASKLFKDGTKGRSPRRLVNGVELAQLLVNQADKAAGQGRRVHQPDRDLALAAAVQANKKLDAEVKVLRRKMAQLDKTWLERYDSKKAG